MDEKDRITVYHISDVEKTYLNYKYTVPAIIDRYKVTLLSNVTEKINRSLSKRGTLFRLRKETGHISMRLGSKWRTNARSYQLITCLSAVSGGRENSN